jgi:16S rRNA (guanine527-N7)-methyltransferase
MSSSCLQAADRAQLLAVLGAARERGFLGPGPVDDHVLRSAAFVAAWASTCADPPDTVLDLGSGGGVPGLILAFAWPASRLLLLDGSERRVAFLRDAITTLGLSERVRAHAQRAEEAGRGEMRGTYPLVVARGFGSPAVTAECGGALLGAEGILAVAEPPGGDPSRWPARSLGRLGLETGALITEPAAVQVLRLRGEFPDRYPRRVGIPTKRPLWS